MSKKYIYWALGIAAAYVVYETWIQPAAAASGVSLPTAGSNPNADMGGLDFGVLDPSNW